MCVSVCVCPRACLCLCALCGICIKRIRLIKHTEGNDNRIIYKNVLKTLHTYLRMVLCSLFIHLVLFTWYVTNRAIQLQVIHNSVFNDVYLCVIYWSILLARVVYTPAGCSDAANDC